MQKLPGGIRARVGVPRAMYRCSHSLQGRRRTLALTWQRQQNRQVDLPANEQVDVPALSKSIPCTQVPAAPNGGFSEVLMTLAL